jgi:hypothetical protein
MCVGDARRLALVMVLATAGCNRDPVPLAVQLAAHDPELSKRLQPAPGTWQREGDQLTSPGWRSAEMGPFYDIGARLPDHADGAIEVGIGQSPEYLLRLEPENAHGVPARDESGRAIYREAYASTDLVFVGDNQRVEWFLVAREASAPTTYTWRVALPSGLPAVRSEPSGALVFCDRAGTARLRIPAPFAIDALGTRRAAGLRWADGRLTVSIDTHGLAHPILLDPAVETALWSRATPNTTAPSVREYTMSAYDSVRARTVLFGGTNGTLLADTWEWDGTSWTLRAPATSPPARISQGMTFDSARARTVLFGGNNGAALGDTWVWDGTNWTQLNPVSRPVPRWGAGMSYDSVRGKTVLFGGYSGTGYLGDTWEWDGTNWAQRCTTLPCVNTTPASRTALALAYDAAHATTVLFGGATTNSVRPQDTWTWNGNVWALLTPATMPAGRSDLSLVYDSARARTVMFGGQTSAAGAVGETWEWDGANWSQRTPLLNAPARLGAAAAYDVARGVTIVFGGGNNSGLLGDTWVWNGAGWAQRAATPSARWGAGMVFDSGRKRSLLVGGVGSSGGSVSDTWEWDGTSWVERAPANAPSRRQWFAMDYDSTRARTVLFGGGVAPTDAFNDTWEFDGTNWSQRAPATVPPGRTGAAMAFDAAHGRSVLFGGNNGVVANYGYYTDTWLWDGNNWVAGTPTMIPPARQFHGMAYDGGAGRVVMFSGVGAGGGYVGDTWLWDGANWSAPFPATSPSARSSCGMAWDSARGRTVMFGGTSASGATLGDTWEWSGANWLPIASGSSPSPRGGVQTQMDFDSARGRIVLFGGLAFGFTLDDTWEYHTHGGPCATGAQCDTGHCVDGVCCESASCGTCEDCNTAASPGICATLTGGQDPDSCTGSMVCGPTGLCGVNDGQVCASASACSSGFCAGGTCCATACDQPCQGCAATPGTCLTIKGADDPASCSGANTCDATGVCKKKIGQLCISGGECASAFCVDSVCCDSACAGGCDVCNLATSVGTCTNAPAGSPGANPACGAFLCSGASPACPTSCAKDTDCISGDFCCVAGLPCFTTAASQNQCLPRQPNGVACGGANQCASDNCVDGFCCESACTGACQQCDATPGTCTIVPAARTGATSCAPYLCDGLHAGCPSSCTSSAQCTSGFACNLGVCTASAKKGIGQMCTVGAECVSSLCVDGYCCDSACDGTCVACNLAGALGFCGPAAANSDPHGSCAGDTGCGGSCDGNGNCKFIANATACDVCKACDGSGHCNQLPSSEDDNRCGSISCAMLSTECLSFADITTRRCVSAGLCAAANDPASCTQSHAATDGTPCATGVCSGGQCVAGSAADLGVSHGGSGGCDFVPRTPTDPTPLVLVLLVLAFRRRAARSLLVLSLAGTLASCGDGGSTPIVVDATAPGRALPDDFLGFSVEWDNVRDYLGDGTGHARDAVVNLLAAFAAEGHRPEVRIGGNSEDQSWWNPNGLPRPAGVLHDLGPTDVSTLADLQARAGSPIVLGLDLVLGDADNAAQLVTAANAALQKEHTFELGNEPDVYESDGRRPAGYDWPTYLAEAHRFRDALAAHFPTPLALQWPAVARPGWLDDLAKQISAEGTGFGIVSTHTYPYTVCDGLPAPAPDALLNRFATVQLAAQYAAVAQAAQAAGVPYRMGELNSVSCGGAHGVSDVYVSALWGADICMQLAAIGIDGVDFHGGAPPGGVSHYAPFVLDATGAPVVRPLYYGMRLVSLVTAANGRLLPVTVTTPAGSADRIHAFATLGDDGAVRILALRLRPVGGDTVSLSVQGAAAGKASLVRLHGAALDASGDLTLGAAEPLSADGAGWRFELPPYDAVVVTLSP